MKPQYENRPPSLNYLAQFIFWSRWLQAPTAIIGISSIHLLKTFINAANYSEKVLIAQTAIHITFLISAMAIAACDRIMPHAPAKAAAPH